MSIHPAPHVVVADRFRLNRLLGRGGMGSVWHATHLGLDIPCAVKFIEGEGAHLPEVQSRFEREAKAAAQLRSPHVVQILDHGVSEGTPYIAMELLDGEDLGKRLMRVGRLPAHELLTTVTQVCRALTKAHSLGIVHRDLKPDNIFIVHDDDREIAKVLDFGIAKATGFGAPGANTRTGAMLGTPYYMSPEQAQGTKAVDARSDLWSLGVIVFEALTGLRPFESEALGDLLMKIIVAPIPVPSQIAQGLPTGFDAWWAKASQRDPAQRFQTAKELCDSLAMAFGRSAGDVAEPAVVPAPARPIEERERPPYGSTGAPIARTFGFVKPAGARSRTAVVVAIAGGMALLGAGIIIVSFRITGKSGSPVAATMGSSVTAVHDAMAVEAPATAQVLAPIPEVSAGAVLDVTPVAPVAPLVAAQAAARKTPAKPFAATRPQPPAPAPVRPASPPPAEAKKKTVDLGI